MPLQWELLGKQELWDRPQPNKGYAYQMLLWRTKVPGGWLLMAVNSKSNNPDPVLSFYPDPDHTWTGGTDPSAEYLLRPMAGQIAPAVEGLLIASQNPDERSEGEEPF